ncbi:MAG TPA: sigma-54 dependent transcriptional regulator [Nitrospiraceae bacterium]|nr:sigma-54 dependent transcriptional regulator [Nitrospiraceae bacterium]
MREQNGQGLHEGGRVELMVVAWDHQSARRHRIDRIVTKLGVRVLWLDEFSAAQTLECSPHCKIALMALGEAPAAVDINVQVVRTLKQKSFKIICYADGAQAWPLTLRCQALLAGSLRILDSGHPEFAQGLESMLEHLTRIEVSKHDEQQEIRTLMTSLGVVGECQAMFSVFRWAFRVGALSDLPVLITGETGTGKQLVAHAIHRLDPKRRKGPFVALNCGAISPGLAETELFGHRRGAYTGADRDRKGLIRSAQGGILFLDEIGELEEGLQAKLLRALQENRVLGVGEDQEVAVDVRIVAATNRDLNEMVREKQFRADLFHRLNVLSIHMPALRDRPGDVRLLVEHFVKKYRALTAAGVGSIEPEFVEALSRISMAGNVRQLENLIRQVLVQKTDVASLGLSHLPPEVWRQLSEGGHEPAGQASQLNDEPASLVSEASLSEKIAPTYLVQLLQANGWNLSRSLRQCEKSLMEAALHRARGNQTETARILGITPRSVYNKLRKHHLHP